MKILLAIDDSKYSEAAVNAVIDQANPADTVVKLLHVLEPFPVGLAEGLGSKQSPDFTAARLELRKEANEFLAKTAERLRSAGLETAYSLEEGEAREVILDYAGRWPADLIVVGSHGRKGLDRFLIGSVSDAVIRHAPCSVEIARTRTVANRKGKART